MRKVIVGAFVSIDGVMQGPGGPDEDPTGGFKYGGWVAPMADTDPVFGEEIGALFGEPYDLLLGRNSAVQSQLGVETIELAGQSDQAKRAAIRAAAERGVVLLYMPGHIMIYLGHERVGGVDHDFGISAISDYLVPCPGGSDTVHRLDRVSVTTLELGRGSERRAYLERIERIALFGPTSGPTTE